MFMPAMLDEPELDLVEPEPAADEALLPELDPVLLELARPRPVELPQPARATAVKATATRDLGRLIDDPIMRLLSFGRSRARLPAAASARLPAP
jgi:hypothetical protein